MACSNTVLAGLGQTCQGSIGGIRKAYIGLQEGFTYTEEGGLVAKDDAKLYRFYVRKQSSSLSSEYTFDDASGSEMWVNTLSLVFARQSKTKREQLSALTAGAPELIAAVQDSNGTWYLLGTENPVVRSAASAATGTANTDANAYSISLEETTPILPLIVDEAKIAAVLEEVEASEE